MGPVCCCTVVGSIFLKSVLTIGNLNSNVDLSGESQAVSTIPPAYFHVYEHDTNMHDASLFESFTVMLNDCSNGSNGGSFMFWTQICICLNSVSVGLFPDMPVDYHGNHPGANANFPSHSAANSMDLRVASGFNFGPNDSEFNFKNMDTDFDFENMDSLPVEVGNLPVDAGATFNYGQDNFQAASSHLVLAHPSHLSIDSDTIPLLHFGHTVTRPGLLLHMHAAPVSCSIFNYDSSHLLLTHSSQ